MKPQHEAPGAAGNPSDRLPALLFLGAAILFYRTIALLAGGAHRVLQPWAVMLTYVEMAIDALTVVTAARWWLTGSPAHARLPLSAGAAATFLHAFRVLVFALGRIGPWVDFDVRPEARPGHRERWTWAQVIFAATMSVLGVAGVFVIRVRRAKSSVLNAG